MGKYFKHLPIFLGMLYLASPVLGQDLTNIKDQKPVKLSGSIGAGSSFYTSNEAYKTRDPFTWNLYANLTANIYGVSLPFSFVVSQYSESYSTPFSQFGLSPTYKWATLLLGYRSMSLSPMIFDGQSFLGGGLELRPGIFRFSGFYGRLNKAITEDTTFDHRIEPQFNRIGYGFKIGLEKNGNELGLSFFHAKDKEGSIPSIKDSLNNLRPQENTAFGSSWSLVFFKKLTFSGDVAASLLNRDMAYGKLDSIGHYAVPGFVRTFSPINNSTVFSYTGRAQLALMLKGINLSGGYQRIQPDYISLGTPYTVNDVETYSGNANTSFFKGRLNFNGSFSAQHNNLSKALATELQTMAGNISINANFNSHLNVNLNVNGANVYQKDGLLKIDETIRMNQLMLSYSLSPSYIISYGTKQHNLSANASFTNLNDRNPETKEFSAGDNVNGSLNYDLQFNEKFFGINSGITYSIYSQQAYKYHSTGINVGANAQFLKEHQLSVQGSVGYFLNKSSTGDAGNNLSFSLNGNVGAGKHSFGLFASYIVTPPVNLNPLDKINRIPIAVNSRNLSAGINYGYSF